MSDSLQPYGPQPARLLCPWDSPAKILEWVAMPSSRGSSLPRDRSHIYLQSPALAGGFFSSSTTCKSEATWSVIFCCGTPRKLIQYYICKAISKNNKYGKILLTRGQNSSQKSCFVLVTGPVQRWNLRMISKDALNLLYNFATHTQTMNIGEIILIFKYELDGECHWLELKRDKDPQILWNIHGRTLRLMGLMAASRWRQKGMPNSRAMCESGGLTNQSGLNLWKFSMSHHTILSLVPFWPHCCWSVNKSRLILCPHEQQCTRPPCPSPSPGVHPDSSPLNQ